MDELSSVSGKKERDYSKMDIDGLVDYILKTHHRYLKENIPQIIPLLEKVVRVHGDSHPKLADAKKFFFEIITEIEPHMLKEEEVLFPYICSKYEDRGQEKCFSSVRDPIHQMEREHTMVGDLLKSLRVACSDYKVPNGACASFMALYVLLDDFEKDIHKHIHLENNILFPKAISDEE